MFAPRRPTPQRSNPSRFVHALPRTCRLGLVAASSPAQQRTGATLRRGHSANNVLDWCLNGCHPAATTTTGDNPATTKAVVMVSSYFPTGHRRLKSLLFPCYSGAIGRPRYDKMRRGVDMELLETLRREVKRSSGSRYEHRLHALLLMVSGFTATQVAAVFGEDPRTVRRWISAFENHGLPGLRDPSRPGRPPSLDAQQQAALRHDLDAPPTAVGLSGDTWNGRLLASHLTKSFDTTLGVRQCQRLLRRIRTSPEP